LVLQIAVNGSCNGPKESVESSISNDALIQTDVTELQQEEKLEEPTVDPLQAKQETEKVEKSEESKVQLSETDSETKEEEAKQEVPEQEETKQENEEEDEGSDDEEDESDEELPRECSLCLSCFKTYFGWLGHCPQTVFLYFLKMQIQVRVFNFSHSKV